MDDVPTGKNIDQFTRFFESNEILAGEKGDRKAYITNRKPLIGKETSTAIIERQDMLSYRYQTMTILEYMQHGLNQFAIDYLMLHLAELKTTPSIDGTAIKEILANKIEYSQRQDVYEHIEQPRKKGFFGK